MVFKYVIVCASALLLQSACSQYIGSGSTVTGNSVVDNNIYVSGSGSGFASGGGYASSGSLGSGIVSSGSLASGIVSGSSLGSGIVSGSSLGSGIVSGSSLGSGIVSGSSLGSGILSSGSLGSGIVTGGLKGHSATVTGGHSSHNVVASSPLLVTSISPIGPSGLAVASENTIEGILTVNGQLPFLSAVAFEGGLPTAGSGVATCGCGSGDVAITSEGLPQGKGLRY